MYLKMPIRNCVYLIVDDKTDKIVKIFHGQKTRAEHYLDKLYSQGDNTTNLVMYGVSNSSIKENLRLEFDMLKPGDMYKGSMYYTGF